GLAGASRSGWNRPRSEGRDYAPKGSGPPTTSSRSARQRSIVPRRGGKRMTRSCPHCGAKVPAVGDAFCPECRNALDEAPANVPQPARPESQGPVGAGAPDVWYATEGRALGWMKSAWEDDRGVIEAAAGSLRFTGRT